MSASQVLARLPLIEQIRDVLGACQYAGNPADYAGQFVAALAAATESPCALWLNWPVRAGNIVAQTECAPRWPLLSLCGDAPLVANDLDGTSGVR